MINVMLSKLKKSILLTLVAIMTFGCTEFLDLVPDSQLTLEMIFAMKEDAWNALAKVYSYMPKDEDMNHSTWLLGDEYMTDAEENKNRGNSAMRIMRGDQNANDPELGYWSGTRDGKHLYKGIRTANIFIQKIDEVTDMSPWEIADWKAQAKFLKAYYHFLLLRSYGPIIIYDDVVSANATGEDMFRKRSKVEDCFDFIIKTINEAIPDLKETSSSTELGQVNQLVAKAIKARIMLYRASPFYSGNMDYYEDFLDFDGKPYFPVYDQPADTKRKWKEALDAIDTALMACRQAGIDRLYEYEKPVYAYDRGAADTNAAKMKVLYDLRMVICDPWNREMIWGLSHYSVTDRPLCNFANMMLPTDFGGDSPPNSGHCDQKLGATYHMLELYYTENGLPLIEDKTFNWAMKHNFITTPGSEEPEYAALRGYLQPGAKTIYLYTKREPRFYANMGITGGYWRSHEVRIPSDFLADSYLGGGGGYLSSKEGHYYYTGIGVQKIVHPESKAGHWMRLVKFPFPLIRVADLYLMKAEALNEYLDAPNQEVWDAVNIVRDRAGIPKVEDAWGGPNVKPEAFNKHTSKKGMQQIIKHERAVELAFEGARFWDLIRWKDAVGELSKPAIGWTPLGSTHETFFVQGIKQVRRFSFRDCLTPITINELNTNSNLKQNPGW
jgi:hypothetical protein